MIDTVKFRVPIDEVIFEKLRYFSVETNRRDNNTGENLFRYTNSTVNVGSFDRKVTVRCSEQLIADIEFSLPKIIFGHNVKLISTDQIEQAVSEVYNKLVEQLGSFPPYKAWRINRLDLCYCWKIDSDEQLNQILKTFKLLNFVGFKKHIYKTSLMFTGSEYAFKYYLKQPEVRTHDFRELRKENKQNIATEALELAKGVLRCELSLRSKKIKYIFGSDFTFEKLLLRDDLYKILKASHNKFTKMDSKAMGIAEVNRLLSKAYGIKKGGKLYTFYRGYFSENELDKQIILDSYSRSTIWRNLTAIKNAGVGIVIDIPDSQINLDIPQNNNPLDAGVGSEEPHQ